MPEYSEQYLCEMLKSLHMTGMLNRLDVILENARVAKLSPREILCMAFEAEMERRVNNRLCIGMNVAHFPRVCTLEGFDFTGNPTVDEARIRDLSSLEWIGQKKNVLFLGPSGTGKTHLAIALGRKAVEKGISVSFITAYDLAKRFEEADRQGLLDVRLKQYAKPRLLIIDEVGYIALKPQTANYFFQLISARYERSSVLLTSNSSLSGWASVFQDITLTSAMLDRLLHHGEIVKFSGDSYRLVELRKSQAMTNQTDETIGV